MKRDRDNERERKRQRKGETATDRQSKDGSVYDINVQTLVSTIKVLGASMCLVLLTTNVKPITDASM